ncbi:MAG: amidohydrolase family protein [Deltaproteobacteria bacterium]|nr:amidohydrolase family protein [Deltaproteobacteria bacterium]MBW2112082.1 amidohydrolase family protein [Deltaproteobacteria bacterium]MBW2352725.1 amidohydrolase family protein [Deltaproteobacteria bacterium]HDZ91260.1 amidohydrolase [Deltaproteobacteria bacterium]
MIIDFHTHIFPSAFRDERLGLASREPAFQTLYSPPGAKLAGVEELIREMDKTGVERSVIFGFPWENPEHYRRHNDYIVESVQIYPDRLTGFCCFSPRSPGGAREAERCLSQGLSGVGELAVYGSGLTSEVVRALEDVMTVCSRVNVPFLLHTNEPVGHEYLGKTPNTLRQIYDFVRTYPHNRIVLAHWGGGLLFYGLMKREVKEVFRNVWFDTAASPFLYTPDIYRVAGEIVGFDRILFGTDYPILGPGRYFHEMNSAGISPRDRDKITGLNAAALLGL